MKRWWRWHKAYPLDDRLPPPVSVETTVQVEHGFVAVMDWNVPVDCSGLGEEQVKPRFSRVSHRRTQPSRASDLRRTRELPPPEAARQRLCAHVDHRRPPMRTG